MRVGRCVREALIPTRERTRERTRECKSESERADHMNEIAEALALAPACISRAAVKSVAHTHLPSIVLFCAHTKSRRTTNDECRTPHELPTALSRGGSPSVRIHINNAVRRTS